jgi:GMP synthase (glutamine-hydrolysing)
MRPVILRTGNTFAPLLARRGDFDHWFADRMGWPHDRLHVVDCLTDADWPDPTGVDGVIVTGSAASVHNEAPWSVRAGKWLVDAHQAGIPILGVCYGHQLLAHALDGRSGPNPMGREVGLCEIEVLEDDPLFEGLARPIIVAETHVDAVLEVPTGARVLACSGNTAVQAMALGENTRTVQWHPEFDGEVMRFYIEARAHLIDAERGEGAAARMIAETGETNSGSTLLRNFARHWLGA